MRCARTPTQSPAHVLHPTETQHDPSQPASHHAPGPTAIIALLSASHHAAPEAGHKTPPNGPLGKPLPTSPRVETATWPLP